MDSHQLIPHHPDLIGAIAVDVHKAVVVNPIVPV